MAHRRRSNSRFEKVIDSTRWNGANHVFLGLSAGSAAQVMVTDGLQETIMRIRGDLVAFVDGASGTGKLVDVAIAALVVQAGSGTTVIQAPITDPDAPWLFYERFTIGYEEQVTDVVDTPQLTSFRKIIDSKAMRILREGREVQLVVQNATLGTATAINLSLGFRMLLGSK